MSIEQVTKVVFLVPRTLTWDKLCALYLWTRCFFPNKRVSSFSELMEAGLADIHFDGEGPRPEGAVDVDVIRDYKITKHGSATERVARENELLDLPGTQFLVKLLNENNRTGGLKSFPKSLVWLIREFFNVGAENPSRERRIEVVDFMWPAVEVFFRACETDEGAEVVNGMKNPFTLESFQKLCVLAKVGGRQAEKWLFAINAMFDVAERKRQVAGEAASKIEAEVFEVPLYPGIGSAVGHFIESDNTRIAAQYLHAHGDDVAILVVRRRSGNVAIFCRGIQSFHDLYSALDGLEEGRWYLETRNTSPMLLNGSTTRDALPTSLRKDALIMLIKRHYQHRSRKDQRR